MKSLKFPYEDEFRRNDCDWERKGERSVRPLRFMTVTISYTLAKASAVAQLPNMDRPIPVIEIFGLTSHAQGGFPVMISVHGFLPYFCVRIEDERVLTLLDEYGPQHEHCRRVIQSVQARLSSAAPVFLVEAIQRKSIMFWSEHTTWFWRITTYKPETVGMLRSLIHRSPSDGTHRLGPGLLQEPEYGGCRTTFEANVPFAVRFLDNFSMPGMGWCDIPAGACIVRRASEAQSYGCLEIDVHVSKLCPLPVTHQENAPIRVMSFDIECMGRGFAMPQPQRDPIGCICATNWEYTAQGKWRKLRGIALSWKKARPPEDQRTAVAKNDVIVLTETEVEMLIMFSFFIRLFDPDIITGYNSNNFDWRYIIHRAQSLRIEQYAYAWDNFFHLGRKVGVVSWLDIKNMVSGAMGEVSYWLLVTPGRNSTFDCQTLRQRNVAEKHASYTLDYVGNAILKCGKIDMPYFKITPMLNGTETEAWEVVRYCLVDAELPMRIIIVKKDVESYAEMARLVYFPFKSLIENGQQGRYQSLLLQNVHRESLYLLPYMQPPPKEKGRKKEKDYEGAVVLEPRVDYYRCEDLPTEASLVRQMRLGRPGMVDEDTSGSGLEISFPEYHPPTETLEPPAKHRRVLVRKVAASTPALFSQSAFRNRTDYAGAAYEMYMRDEARRMIARLRPSPLKPDGSRLINTPVATLDFASLYPSIMIANNMCYSTHVSPKDLPRLKELGIPVRRMANGEYFIDPWDPVSKHLLPGESLPDGIKRLRSVGQMVEVKLKRHEYELDTPAAELEEARRQQMAVPAFGIKEGELKLVEEETEYVNYKPTGKNIHRFYARYEEVQMVRIESRVGVLMNILEKMLAARKAANGAKARAQNRQKMFSNVLGVALLSSDSEKDVVTGLTLLIDDAGVRTLRKTVPKLDPESIKKPETIRDLLYILVGKTETYKHWKRVWSRLLEFQRAALEKILGEFGKEAEEDEFLREKLGVLRNDGVSSILHPAIREWVEGQINTWEGDASSNDARQMALKVVCNSVYGATGATVGKLPDLGISSAVTAMGRKMIMQCKSIAEEYDPTATTNPYARGCSPYRTRVVYGDSITGQMPVIYKLDEESSCGALGFMKKPYFQEAIEELFARVSRNTAIDHWHDGKDAMVVFGMYALTEKGWTPIRRIIRHIVPKNKRIVRVYTKLGCVEVTDDHSLLRPNVPVSEEKIKASELKVGTDIVHCGKEKFMMSMIAGYYDSSPVVVKYSAWRGCAFAYVQDVWKSLRADQAARIFSYYHDADVQFENGAFTVIGGKGVHRDFDDCSITKIEEVEHNACLVYDLETENHHYQAGIGHIVVHNTDSVFVGFEGCPTIEEAFSIARNLASKCTASMYSGNVKLELEKVFRKLLLMSKKRYWGEKVEYNKNNDPVTSEYNRGTEKVRRDNAVFVRRTISRALEMVTIEDDPLGAIAYVQDVVRQMYAGELPIEDFVITKAVSKNPEDYKTPQAHIELRKRMLKRTPGGSIELGERVPFVLVQARAKSKVIDMVEDPEYVKKHGIPLNIRAYVDSQLVKPLCRFFGPFLSNADTSQDLRLERAWKVLFDTGAQHKRRLANTAHTSLGKWLKTEDTKWKDVELEEDESDSAEPSAVVASAKDVVEQRNRAAREMAAAATRRLSSSQQPSIASFFQKK